MKTQKNKSIFHVLLLTIVSLSSWLNIYSQGDLMVTPTRLVMEDNQYTKMVTLVNIGKDTAVYSVSFLEYRMTPQGGIEQIKTPDENQLFASKHLRVFPRRFTLAPNVAQTMRVQFRRDPEMTDGEYRSHLYFRDEQINTPAGMPNDNPDAAKGISIQLIPVYGISIPAIVRVGDLSVEATITDINCKKITDEQAELDFTIERHGTKSVYGDIVIEYWQEGQEKIRIANLGGNSIYTPNNLRHFKHTINRTEGINLTKGKIRVSYVEDASKQDTEIFARKTINLEEL
ncbi:hypothetical protein CLV33_103107 [Jejuia pallidilutea]|uniref:Molecular chaperone n=1 Tax=Jejuia pallidilutea TaxID=504487 RepID=A0A362XAV4_9FLAO|nr:molecular chaperone [Jejuia pallidilutea]PQV49476.1 hypothetical protein CLV33_103107 [Jejuia pallidilutea]